jgi:hypothetical protein
MSVIVATTGLALVLVLARQLITPIERAERLLQIQTLRRERQHKRTLQQLRKG